jgi:hypothetical protein
LLFKQNASAYFVLLQDEELAYSPKTDEKSETAGKATSDGRPSWMRTLHESVVNW